MVVEEEEEVEENEEDEDEDKDDDEDKKEAKEEEDDEITAMVRSSRNVTCFVSRLLSRSLPEGCEDCSQCELENGMLQKTCCHVRSVV